MWRMDTNNDLRLPIGAICQLPTNSVSFEKRFLSFWFIIGMTKKKKCKPVDEARIWLEGEQKLHLISHLRTCMRIYIVVGSRFSGQAHNEWDLELVSPVQWICKKWTKELGCSVWTTVIMVLFTIKLGWTGFIREDWSSSRFEESFLIPLVC